MFNRFNAVSVVMECRRDGSIRTVLESEKMM